MKFLNIAVDGVSGSGKTTICDILAKKLGINHLSSGAIYRAIALYIIKTNINYLGYVNNNKQMQIQVKEDLKNCNIEVKFDNFIQKIYLNKVDCTNLLNTNEISNVASIISQNHTVREMVKEIQLKLASTQDIIIDGRDITSEVLVDADFKFFITASIDVRAERRFLQYNKKVALEEIKKELAERDYRDEHREISPLKIVKDATIIDTTNINVDDAINKMLYYIKQK